MAARIPYTACPLCEGPQIAERKRADCTRHPLYRPALPATMIWKQCQACAHVFTDGYFSTGDAEVVFSAINDSQKLGNDIERQRQVSARMVEKVLPYVTAGTWLDVGFGNGALLLTAQEYGFTPVGTDLRAQNTAALKSINIEAHACDITALTLSQPCAVISMADVLEHMPFPKEGLRAAHRLLADDGVLFISMPNADSMLWRILDVTEANPYWGELEHYHNFGRTRLYALLREMGFEPLRYGVSERYRACMEVIAKKKR